MKNELYLQKQKGILVTVIAYFISILTAVSIGNLLKNPDAYPMEIQIM